SAAFDKTVRVWDWAGGKEVLNLEHPDPVVNVVYSPDGKRIVGTGKNGKVRVWDAQAGTETHTLSHGDPWVLGLCYSPDGKLLATGSGANNDVKLWDAVSFKEVATLPTGGQWLAFTPDSRTLLAGNHDHMHGTIHTVARWDVASGKELARMPLRSQGGYAFYHLSPDGKTLFALRAGPAPADPFVR